MKPNVKTIEEAQKIIDNESEKTRKEIICFTENSKVKKEKNNANSHKKTG